MSSIFNGSNHCTFEYDDKMKEKITMKDADGNTAYMDPQDVADFIEHDIIYNKGSIFKLIGNKPNAVIERFEVRFTERIENITHGKTE